MNVQVHSIRFDADSKLINFIQGKINKLDMFYNEITSTDVYLRLDKNNSEGNKVAEIKMNIPGKELFAKRQCKSFEEATDLAVEALRKQIKRTKGKQRKAG